MRGPIEDHYFSWLCAKVLEPHSRIYKNLLRILYQTEFVWLVEGDRNRAEDGCELREDFLRTKLLEADRDWFNEPCSVLEALVAFANRASFETGTPMRDWFWHLMGNLGLGEYRQVDPEDVPDIEEILDVFVWRKYNDSGHGGLFPMRWPKNDQRRVEIWYQFYEYLDEQGLM